MAAIQTRTSKAILTFVLMAFMLALPLAAFAQGDDRGFAGVLVGGAIWIVLCLATFILHVVILIWVYQDANKRGANGLLWAVIVLIIGLVGLLLYFAVGRNQNRMA